MHRRESSINDFRGDFLPVAAMVQRSFAENAPQALLYSADFLASLFEYPGASFSLAPSVYDSSGPLGFVAGFPRRIRLQGRELRIILGTSLAVSPEYKNRGIGVILWSELVKRAQAAGFDGMLAYCVEGDPMNRMVLRCGDRLGLPIRRIYSIRHWATLLRSNMAPELGTGVWGGRDAPGCVEAFMEIAATIGHSTPLARIWSKEEATWQCTGRSGSILASYSRGLGRGLMTGYVMQIANRQRTNCLLIEDVLWGDLEREERQVLLGHFLVMGVKARAQMAILRVLGYADIEPFVAARFLPTPRVFHAYLTLWSGQLPVEELSSMYIDVV